MNQKNTRKGYYLPKNADKYIGDVSKIMYRSSWELAAFKFFDGNPNIIRWGSEEIAIPYIKPTTGKLHKYYPDIYVEYINNNREYVKEIIEIKPETQTKTSTARKKKTKLYENVTYAINVAKWMAAKKWCEERGITFRLMTEKQMFK